MKTKIILVGVFGLLLAIGSRFTKSEPSSDTQPKPAHAGITMATFDRLALGISYQEAVAILGKEGIEQGRNAFGETETVIRSWQFDSGAFIQLIFQNGQLKQKTQFGLTPKQK